MLKHTNLFNSNTSSMHCERSSSSQYFIRESSLSALYEANDNTEETESWTENLNDEKSYEGFWGLSVGECETTTGDADADSKKITSVLTDLTHKRD